jgi:hypothetical protein
MTGRPGTAAQMRSPKSRRASLGAFASANKRQSLGPGAAGAQLRQAASDVQRKLDECNDSSLVSPLPQTSAENKTDINLMPEGTPGEYSNHFF